MDNVKLDQLIEKTMRAIELVRGMAVVRVDVNDYIKVYRVKNIVRIDVRVDG